MALALWTIALAVPTLAIAVARKGRFKVALIVIAVVPTIVDLALAAAFGARAAKLSIPPINCRACKLENERAAKTRVFMVDGSSLDAHVEGTARTIADLHAEHYARASWYERSIARLTDSLVAPAVAGAIGVLLALWLVVNATIAVRHGRALDPPPYAYLQAVVGIAALVMTVVILTSQRHDYWLAERRAQMTLQLVMVSEQKIAKLIELVEHLRRDDPQIVDRIDVEATQMARPLDSQRITEAVDAYRDEYLASKEE